MGVHACVGAWLSLVEHSVRDRGVGGSNPLAPTNFGATGSALRADFTPSRRLGSLHYARASPARSVPVAFCSGYFVPGPLTRFRLRAERYGETSPKLEERRRALAGAPRSPLRSCGSLAFARSLISEF